MQRGGYRKTAWIDRRSQEERRWCKMRARPASAEAPWTVASTCFLPVRVRGRLEPIEPAWSSDPASPTAPADPPSPPPPQWLLVQVAPPTPCASPTDLAAGPSTAAGSNGDQFLICDIVCKRSRIGDLSFSPPRPPLPPARPAAFPSGSPLLGDLLPPQTALPLRLRSAPPGPQVHLRPPDLPHPAASPFAKIASKAPAAEGYIGNVDEKGDTRAQAGRRHRSLLNSL